MASETPEQKAKRLGVPVVPANPLPMYPDPNPTVGVCGACSMELKQVMHYYCNRNDCPVFTKPMC